MLSDNVFAEDNIAKPLHKSGQFNNAFQFNSQVFSLLEIINNNFTKQFEVIGLPLCKLILITHSFRFPRKISSSI